MTNKIKAAEFTSIGYNINVVGRHVLVTDAMKDYAIEKVSKIERFSERIIDVSITMDVQKLEHRVDIIAKVGNVLVKSSATTDNMYASIDKATDKLQRQLLKYKKKIQEHNAREVPAVEMKVNIINSIGSELEEVNDEIESETRRRLIESYGPHEVVSVEKCCLKTLRVDEAVMKMDLSGDVFKIFRSEEDRKLKVIYRRREGNYGIIEVES